MAFSQLKGLLSPPALGCLIISLAFSFLYVRKKEMSWVSILKNMEVNVDLSTVTASIIRPGNLRTFSLLESYFSHSSFYQINTRDGDGLSPNHLLLAQKLY